MTRLKAVILDYQSLAPNDLDTQPLSELAVDWVLHDYTPADETLNRIQGMQIVLTNKVIIDESMMRKSPSIKLIIITATGTNNVDLQAAKLLGITVCNIVGYSTESVVQHTFASLLALQSRLIEYDAAVKQGRWCESQFFGLLEFPIREVAGKTLGIIGFGAIGKRVKQVAEAFGMKVIVAESITGEVSRLSDRVSLRQLYQQADVISIHCPLSDYSRNLINADAFAAMKSTAIVLNMGRGGIVDEQALMAALNTGKIAAAATDVLTQEPPAKDHVLLVNKHPRLIITPHTAWASREARQALISQVVNIILGFSRNHIINQVNP